MRERNVSSFSFLGKRGYIQGGTLLCFALQCVWRCEEEAKEVEVQHFKIYREVNRNVLFAYQRGETDDLAAEVSYAIGGKRRTAFLLTIGTPVTDRIPDAIAPVELLRWDEHFSGEGNASGIRGFADVIEGIVELNKRVHLLSPQVNKLDPHIRVVSLMDFKAWRSVPAKPLYVSIRKSGERSYGGLRYTLSDVSLSLGELCGKMKICFSYKGYV